MVDVLLRIIILIGYSDCMVKDKARIIIACNHKLFCHCQHSNSYNGMPNLLSDKGADGSEYQYFRLTNISRMPFFVTKANSISPEPGVPPILFA